MSADWPRYVFASIADSFKTVATGAGIPVLIEHLDERTAAFMQATDRAEIRITGPLIREISKDHHLLQVDVNVLLVSRYEGASKNPYDIIRYAGVFSNAMEASIGVWNFGNQSGDYLDDVLNQDDEVVVDNSATRIFIGCLSLRPGQSVLVQHHGQVDPVEKIKMSEVSAKYEMDIQE
jgi:hypothetical protein